MVMTYGTTGEQSMSPEEETQPSAGTDQGKGGGGPTSRSFDAEAPANDATADDAPSDSPAAVGQEPAARQFP
jgi:hypothetical protein